MDYQTFNTLLKESGADISAAEAHGVITGMLCVDAGATVDNCLPELFAKALPSDETVTLLTDLFEWTNSLLAEGDYRLELLLPSDDDSLENRVEALREWCQGFLFGLGYGWAENEVDLDSGRQSTTRWPGETGEILQDIVEFTKMDVSGEGPSAEEDDASAFVEIYEYLRIAVFLIRNEFNKSTDTTYH